MSAIEQRSKLITPEVDRLLRITVFIAHESAAGFSADNGQASIGSKAGGAAVVAEMQARELALLGHNVKLVSPLPHGISLEDDNLHRFIRNSIRREVPEILRGEQTKDLEDEVLASIGDSDVVYVHYPAAGAIVSRLIKSGRLKNTKMIYMGHSWDRVVQTMDNNRSITDERNRAELITLTISDRIIVATQAERQILAKNYGGEVVGGAKAILEKTEVVPLGVDTKTISPQSTHENRRRYRNLLPIDLQNSVNLFMLGRVSSQKGQLNAVQAFCKVLSENPDLNLSFSIHGGPLEGDYYDKILTFLKTQPEKVNRRVIFHGVQPPLSAISCGDIFLGPSAWETWFLSATEAMAGGKPAILSDNPILREVAGESNLFVDPLNINDLSAAIVKLSIDHELRSNFGIKNSERAANYTWTNSAHMLSSIMGRTL